MSQDIIDEVYFLASSVCMGVIITFVYDFILIGRRVVRHSHFFLSLEDFIFWAVCAITVFYMLYKENNGILRWFAVFGAALGMLLYKKTIGRFFVRMLSSLIQKEIHMVKKVLGFLFSPIRWLAKEAGKFGRFAARKERRIYKHLKKKLTASLKMLKITLCKH